MSPVLDRLPILILQPHNRCNCRCVMCDIWKITDAQEISAAELERHMADIEQLGVEWAVFTGGEPLMHSDLFRLCGMLAARGIRTTLLSSGLLLARHAARIVEGIGDVIVSLDGPPQVHNQIRGIPQAFERLAEGVRAIHGIAPDYPIAARCTVQSANAAHLRETVQTARELGLRSISFLAADLTSTAFNRPLIWPADRQSAVAPDLDALAREIDSLPEDGFVVESRAKLRRIMEQFRAPTAPRCNAPWVSAVLEPHGDVRPCFFHPPIGNTLQGTLADVVNGPAAVAFRARLNIAEDPICRRCVCSLYRD